MSEVCRDFGISRKTGYKIFTRHKDQGLEALCDRSRRPVRYANQLPPQIENQIVSLKREKPHWGARKRWAQCPATAACPGRAIAGDGCL
jgi:transposase